MGVLSIYYGGSKIQHTQALTLTLQYSYI